MAVCTVQPELRAIRSQSPVLRATQNNDNDLDALWRPPASDVVSSSTDRRYSWQSSFLGNDVALHPHVPAPCIHESVLYNINAYINVYYFKSDRWLPYKDNILGEPNLKSAVEADSIVLIDPESLVSAVLPAAHLFDRGYGHRAVSMIDSACAMIQRLVNEQHPQLLSKLLMAVSYMKAAKYKELIQEVLLHFYNMADILFGPQHPFSQLSSWLSKASA